MIKNNKVIALILIIITITFVHTLPKAQYKGTHFISKLNVPLSLSGWNAQDVSYQVVASLDKHPDKFSNEALAYQYKNKDNKYLLFIILDAGNFHHPNVCFTSAGYEIEDLQDTDFKINGHSLKAHTLLTKKDNKSALSFYWISIDKKIAHKWLNQKLKQLYYSLLNKKRVGLMVRMDIPAQGDEIPEAISLAQQFITELGQSLNSEQADYIFGQK